MNHNIELLPIDHLSELNVGDKCVMRSKHPMNLSGDFIFSTNYLVVKIEEQIGNSICPIKVTLKEEITGKEYRLLNTSDGYAEVTHKYNI